MMDKIHSEIRVRQVEFNELLMKQKEYTQDVVPSTYHYYKDIKDMTYSTLPFGAPKLQNETHASSEALEFYAD